MKRVEQGEYVKNEFPIAEGESRLWFREDTPELPEGVIVHYFVEMPRNAKLHRYALQKTIGDATYIFEINEGSGEYGVSFKTKEYEYALMELTAEARKEVLNTLTTFISTVTQAASIDALHIYPADQSYTRQEVDTCIERILATGNVKTTREALLQEYPGVKIFDFYREVTGTPFFDVHPNHVSRSDDRARVFKRLFERNLAGWEVVDDPWGAAFTLRRVVPSA